MLFAGGVSTEKKSTNVAQTTTAKNRPQRQRFVPRAVLTLGGTPAASIQSRTTGDERTRARDPRGRAEAEGTDGQAACYFPGFRPMDASSRPRPVQCVVRRLSHRVGPPDR